MDDKLDELQRVTVRELIDFFGAPKPLIATDEQLNIARLAVSTLSAVGRIKATERAKDATQLMVIKHLATDQNQFRQYVQLAMPHLNPAPLVEN